MVLGERWRERLPVADQRSALRAGGGYEVMGRGEGHSQALPITHMDTHSHAYARTDSHTLAHTLTHTHRFRHSLGD